MPTARLCHSLIGPSLCCTLILWGALATPGRVAAQTSSAKPVATSNTTATAAAVEPQLQPQREVLDAIAKLGPNSSCLLPQATVISDGLGDFNKGYHQMATRGPGGRDFTIKMAWMPDRQRAFFCGANHGSPHRMNDAWEYDLASNTWVLLYVPDYNDSGPIKDYDKETLVIDKGWLRTKKGGPAHPAHTWWGLTYDPQAKRVLWYCAWPSYRLDAKLEAIGATRDDLYKGPPLWTFDPAERRWEPLPTQQPWPSNKFGAALEYVPELGGSLWMYGNSRWQLDFKNAAWHSHPGSGASLPIETLTCYAPDRKLMIAHRGIQKEIPPRTWHMPIGRDGPGTWEKVLEQEGLPNGHDARSWMYYDPVGRVALLYENKTGHIWSYNPDERQWTKHVPEGPLPDLASGKGRAVAYFDHAHNVFVVIGPESVWCYRYAVAKK